MIFIQNAINAVNTLDLDSYSTLRFFQIQAVDTSSRTMAWLTESGLWSSNSMALSLQLAQEIQTEVKLKESASNDDGG